ncbi:uncharacterized protein STEHIDRAFT_34038, partial [Stereum hirsutum FP-91666 SS1]|uniref:uncharacterized protein n=1 Tax=Stereum hirsutum (strain FP-91666) TaxID=721885 RepID=UPI0004449492
DQNFVDLIASLKLVDLQELALSTRRLLSITSIDENLSCSLELPPLEGGFHVFYKVSFSDGVCWGIRIALDERTPSAARSMQLDIAAQRYITSHTSIPIPSIHHFSLDCDNPISHPFTIMDFIPGTPLSKSLANKEWMTNTKRTYIFEQLAKWMTELSSLEFDEIGPLDVDPTTGVAHVVPFPDGSSLVKTELGDSSAVQGSQRVAQSAGPFSSTHALLSYQLSLRRQTEDSPKLRLLQLFSTALLDPELDGPPFTLRPPDFESQNVLVTDDGTITALIDWDGVCTCPRQGGAAAYPSWLTTDWDPLYYGWYEGASAEHNARYDSPAELASYREMYLEAIDRASGGKLTHITRNSHIYESLSIGVGSPETTIAMVLHLGKYVWGPGLSFDVMDRIGNGPWFNQGKGEIARV